MGETKETKAKKAKKEKEAASFAVRAEEESTPWWQWPGMPGAVLIAQPEGTYDNEGEASFQREVGGGEEKDVGDEFASFSGGTEIEGEDRGDKGSAELDGHGGDSSPYDEDVELDV